ncbi:MAG: type II toxin-antitoxin system Phd/YefM family antitoxin [Desulfuromonadales bacterium]|nr:type II toxin-antitoxin system Phd/YefM family antitoxin [Desulfuromonadales bacterium]
MKLENDIQPVTYLKSHAADLLQQVNETRRPVIITQNGHARAVLQDPRSYEEMRATITLLKLMVQGEDDLRSGRVMEQDEVFAEIEARLATPLVTKR